MANRPVPQGPICVWQGLDLPNWFRLLKLRPPMAWSHWIRIGGVAVTACSNTVFGAIERLLYSRLVKQTKVPAPVFIVGHWRSGTTLLHNLLSLDPRFATPNLYHTVFPGHFLFSEKILGPLTAWMLPQQRTMDEIPVAGWDIPQEDEIAICLLSLISPYLMLAFPENLEVYAPYLDMKGIPESERARWKEVFYRFLQKVTIRNSGRRLVLKSPTHSYRIPLLLEMFPDAKFVHIVRNPYRVLSSSLHLRRVAFPDNAFYSPSFDHIEDDVMHLYQGCFEHLEHDLPLLGPHQLHELRMEDLETDILGELKRLYDALGLDGFELLEQRVRPNLPALHGHKKNQLTLPESLQRKLEQMCPKVFERYGYPRLDRAADEPLTTGSTARVAV
ncbi:MAG: sulfotransferase [Planctomycetaceae bacterium]|nr:sulfotransferase [Planctomycetaceae bacterium]